jgi:hypothetical protein
VNAIIQRYQNLKRTNRHGKHVASCLCCANLYATMGEPGYSEMTPGSPPDIRCEARALKLDVLTDDVGYILHEAARHCIKFAPRPALKQGEGRR